MPAGYSGTPLIRKLGLKAGFHILLVNEPAHYRKLIGEWPEDVKVYDEKKPDSLDFIHLFTQDKAHLKAEILRIKPLLSKKGMLWVSWPKGSSKLSTEVNGNDVREIGLATGLVDVKVAAIDSDWSGLKFVFRKEDR